MQSTGPHLQVWIKNAKRELEQAKTRAEGLEVFEIDAWRSRKSFECENGRLNEAKGRNLVAVGQNPKVRMRQSETRLEGPKLFEISA